MMGIILFKLCELFKTLQLENHEIHPDFIEDVRIGGHYWVLERQYPIRNISDRNWTAKKPEHSPRLRSQSMQGQAIKASMKFGQTDVSMA